MKDIPLLRKLRGVARQVPRAVARWQSSAADYQARPPVLANSFPKSGTNLLTQIVEALPGLASYGTVTASIPTLPHRRRPVAKLRRRLLACAPGELVFAHLECEPAYVEALRARNFVSFFIYRDPRDVVVSEAHYLATMNRWHSMHSRFRALPDAASRLSLAIEGLTGDKPKYDYRDIGSRFRPYLGWIGRPDVCAVKYEDLTGPNQDATLRRIIDFYLAKAPGAGPADALTELAANAINPSRSRTFRKGGSGEWKQAFSPEHKALFKRYAGSLLVELGYETGLDW